MEKAPIKKFAVEARKKLKADVTFQLERYGITENGIVEPQTSTDKELVFDLGNGNVQTIRGVRAVNQYKNLAAHVRGLKNRKRNRSSSLLASCNSKMRFFSSSVNSRSPEKGALTRSGSFCPVISLESTRTGR